MLYQLAPMPPYFTVEFNLGSSGEIACCEKENGGLGIMFVGSVTATVDVGAGTIIGGQSNTKIGKGGKTFHHATGKKRGKFIKNPFNKKNVNSGFDYKVTTSPPKCEDSLKLTLELNLYIKGKLSFIDAKGNANIGTISWPGGEGKWQFSPSGRFSTSGSITAAGIRAGVEGKATTKAKITLIK